MNFSFFSLVEASPPGFEKKNLQKNDLLKRPVVILADNAESVLSISKDLHDRIIGVIVIPGHAFQFKQLGKHLLEIYFPIILLDHIKDITTPILNVLEGKSKLLDEERQLESRLQRINRDLLETTKDYQSVVKDLQKKVDDITAAQSEILELNQVLETKVDLRTAQLANVNQILNERNSDLSSSLDSINRLKSQQDADYALTAILLEPLISNNNIDSKNINLEFFTKQKKSFQFRNRIVEIGGDIIAADTITLNGEIYTLLLNADAMGKSLQGACGALVLGVIFKSIVTHTHLYAESKHESPEAWLTNTVSEIQRIFEAFDGNMQASLILGIILERIDTLFYVNTDHPPVVLYRDENVSILQEQEQNMKIGLMGLGFSVHVEHFQLLPGDILFIGSDGKDDIILTEEDTNKERVNTDTNLFLNIVEKEKGNLQQIVKEIENQGSLMDDLSILRVAYKCN